MSPAKKPDADAHHDGKPVRLKPGTRFRNYFFTGLVIAAPISITIYITWSFINLIDKWFKPLVPAVYNPDTYLPFSVPGVGVIFAMMMITLLGFLTANLFGRTLVAYGETIVHRTPLISSIYKALKQIFETALAQGQSSFTKVGLIEYPRKGIHAVVFIATDTKGEIAEKVQDGEPTYSVFLPTTPNPTSGFLLFVKKADVTLLDMSVEDAAKTVISAGLVVPDYEAPPKAVDDPVPSTREAAE
ncbi:MAG: DUF502 domain-containing protein [Pseudomonadota bacterium]